MPLTFYYMKSSPPSRSVDLVIHALGLTPEYRVINLSQKDHLTPEYLKINPLHTVPAIDDNGFVLWESRAIMTYLVSKYGKDDSLYPKDIKKRALVDQMLHYSNEVFTLTYQIIKGIFFQRWKDIPEDMKTKVQEIQSNVEKLLGGHDFIAGDTLTVADHSYITVMEILAIFLPMEDKFPSISKWMERCKVTMVGFAEVNEQGRERLIAFFQEKLSHRMNLTFYYLEATPPSRSVDLVIHALDLSPEYKTVNLQKKEHLTPQFLKMNPLHTVPAIDDDGFVLWESAAIMTYLVSQYGKDDSLYPKNINKRALVDQTLHYSNDVFSTISDVAKGINFSKLKVLPQDLLAKVKESQDNVEKLIGDHDFIAGDSLTVADYSYITMMDVLDLLSPMKDKCPSTRKWMDRCKLVMKDFEKVNKRGADRMLAYLKENLDLGV